MRSSYARARLRQGLPSSPQRGYAATRRRGKGDGHATSLTRGLQARDTSFIHGQDARATSFTHGRDAHATTEELRAPLYTDELARMNRFFTGFGVGTLVVSAGGIRS